MVSKPDAYDIVLNVTMAEKIDHLAQVSDIEILVYAMVSSRYGYPRIHF